MKVPETVDPAAAPYHPPMAEVDFTAGITLNSGEVLTVDVTAVDAEGIRHRPERGREFVAWSEVKAVMLATTDHMIESGGYLFSMAERMQDADQEQPYEADAMRRLGAGLLRQAAPRICPNGAACPLAAPPPPPGAPPSA